MAFTIVVYPELNPRIIEILAPTLTASVQQIVNAVRAWEDSTIGMNYPFLIDAAGKEDLGGGVSVGITATLQNAQIAFEQRGVSDDTGTVTTGSTDGKILIDTSATFITAGILAGDSIYNISDGSMTTILEVVSEIKLVTFALQGGTDNQWDVSDNFRIWNKIQCEINGGNLVAVDINGDAMSSFLPTAETHVVRTSSSSATIAEQEDIQYASFNGGVTYDLINGQSGTEFPIGTPRAPSSVQSDLHSISQTRGLNKIFILGDLTLSATNVWDGHEFIGEATVRTTITIPALVSVFNCEFFDAQITGTLDGGSQVERCLINNLNFVDGYIFNCALLGTITLGTSTIANILQCYSAVAGVDTPIIDMNETGILALRDYFGGVKLINYSGTGSHSIDLSSGQLILDSNTIVSGTFVVRGIGKLIDENGTPIDSGTWNGGVTIINELLNGRGIADMVWDEPLIGHTTVGTTGKAVLDLHNEAFGKWVIDPIAKTLTLYETDGVTVLKVFDLTSTVADVPAFIARTPQP